MYDVESPEYIAWADNVGADMEEYDSLFEDAYAGEWENVREFLEDFMDNTGAFVVSVKCWSISLTGIISRMKCLCPIFGQKIPTMEPFTSTGMCEEK